MSITSGAEEPIIAHATLSADRVGQVTAQEFSAGRPFVYWKNVPFANLHPEAQAAYITEACETIGEITPATPDPQHHDTFLWNLDATRSPGTVPVPYHTDNPAYAQPERIVSFWNVRSAAEGGENLILPVSDLLEETTRDESWGRIVQSLLSQNITFADGFNTTPAPIFDADERTARLDAKQVPDPVQYFIALSISSILGELFRDTARAIKLEPGDVLFFDNRRTLHAREPYVAVADRLSIRARIAELKA